MTTELTKAAQQALEALIEASGHVNNQPFVKVMMARDALVSALTQRPAAQTERDTGPRVLREVFALCEDTMDKMAAESTEFSRGRAFEAKGISRAIGTWFQDEYCGQSHMGEPSLPAPQQATQFPLDLVSDPSIAPGEVVAKLDGKEVGRVVGIDTQQATPEPWCPDVCPITGLAFFMWIEHHKTGQMVPTYGGPYDSYTIPVRDADGSYCRERYDHDRGGWLVDEVQDVGVQIVSDQAYVSDEPPATPEPVGERWVVVRETALDVGRGNDVRTGGRPELGYALISDAATFGSEGEAVAAIKSASLPVGWVVLPLSRLLPDLGYTRPAPGVPDGVRTALEFYAGGNHFVRADADAWETVSGEPPNFWEDEANTATVEDGTIARNALAALAAAQAKGS